MDSIGLSPIVDYDSQAYRIAVTPLELIGLSVFG